MAGGTVLPPVPVTANTKYVASYHAPYGRYSKNDHYFEYAHTNGGQLVAIASTTQDQNGVYRYGSTAFPIYCYNNSNYWVDVIYSNMSGRHSKLSVNQHYRLCRLQRYRKSD
jgi:hypothetical protein